MFGHEFYHGTLRRYVMIFGTLFNEIIISRDDNSGTQQKRFTVPISYGPMQKFLAMIQSNPILNQSKQLLYQEWPLRSQTSPMIQSVD